ncbi:MAG: A/G-specific adenine glycosylase [Actinobacteria bacterium]|nr:A/G-specific adenine glycosylase [Actinomycetota bacterium]
MLQQTQVARVVPRYEAFLTRFPSAAACAAAPAGEVLRLWSGLGYNSRALNLHRAAVACVQHHGGQLPLALDTLRELPGVGPYTARAVMAFAHERDVGVVDTNAARVLARLAGRRLRLKEAQQAADALVPGGAGWAWNQAMLDLGANVCTKRAPACGACPLRPHCGWAGAGHAPPDPATGSAATGRRQSRFAGSDRQGRGRLVESLRAGPVAPADLPQVMGWAADPVRARRVAAALVADGLAVQGPDGALRLP